jgi:hypothetical protein
VVACVSVYGCTAFVNLGRFFSFLIYTQLVGLLGRVIARPLPTHRRTQIQNKRSQTSVPRVGFEPTIPVFKRAKTVHELHRAATVIGARAFYRTEIGILPLQLQRLRHSSILNESFLFRFLTTSRSLLKVSDNACYVVQRSVRPIVRSF